jgi:hypothetical protein
MRIIYLFILNLTFIFSANAQLIDCSKLCVTNISLDSITGILYLDIYNSSNQQINYPRVEAVINDKGDTLVYSNNWSFYAQTGYTSVTYDISTKLTSLPDTISNWMIEYVYSDFNNNGIVCNLPYPCDTNNITTIGNPIIINSDGIWVFPNPTSDIINIHGLSHQVSIKLYDALGKEMRVTLNSRTGNLLSFSIEDLNEGVYYLLIQMNDKNITKRIIKTN